MSRRCGGRDRGSAAIQLAIVALVVFVFFAVITIAGRYCLAGQAADAAAFEAARVASQAPDAATAAPRAHEAAQRSLAAQGIRCRVLEVQVDISGFDVPAGTAANIAARITCQVDNTDVAVPGMPGITILTSVFYSPLDLYRSRSCTGAAATAAPSPSTSPC